MPRTHEELITLRNEMSDKYHLVFPDIVLEPLWWGRRPENRILDRFAIVDQNTDQVYNVCTDEYKPIPHEEVIKMVEEVTGSMVEFGKPVIEVNLLADGGKLNIHVTFPEVEYQIKPGDSVNPTADIRSSYDLGWKYGGMFGAYRLVCSNGLKVGEVFDSFKKRHLQSLDPEQLRDVLTNGMTRFSEQTDLWQSWANQAVSLEKYDSLWKELPFSEPEREKIENLREAGTGSLLKEALNNGKLTRWDFYNTTTQYASHEITSAMRRIEIQPKITRAFERFF